MSLLQKLVTNFFKLAFCVGVIARSGLRKEFVSMLKQLLDFYLHDALLERGRRDHDILTENCCELMAEIQSERREPRNALTFH